MSKEKLEAMSLAMLASRLHMPEREVVALAAGLAQFASGSYDAEVEAERSQRRAARDDAPLQAAIREADRAAEARNAADRAERVANAAKRTALQRREDAYNAAMIAAGRAPIRT